MFTSGGTVTDIEGNVYSTVTIGTQVWMKENLKITKYRNGNTILTTSATNIPTDSTSKYQWANYNDSNVATYGRLYTWYTVTDSRNICPVGWHVPSDAEWTTLTDYLGSEEISGGKMKENGTSHWNYPNTGANNSSGFTALPGGYRIYDNGSFWQVGGVGDWWSASEKDATNAWGRGLSSKYSFATRDNYNKSYGFSVRCIKD
ncbi:MAG: hypothetical protein A3G23_04840 [Bacteroidetes bacterium RIFCSPLOWO2_12_FULL_37_12]|nr:MAG: hypothetical protein A3G23_04840 [Bacteroidetes bacterium RIFCSPLOWO2_12_FULL_37_12]